jgi:RNA polymerase sigma-70 factor (ECF subfamily)
MATQGFLEAENKLEPIPARLTAQQIEEQIEELVATYRPQIFRFLLVSLRDREEAETLTQECFLRAWRNWAGFRGDSSARTWLMQIAINLLRDHWRSRRMQFWRTTQNSGVDVDEACDWLPSHESSPEASLSAKQQVQRVWQAVEDLSERQRTVFLLRYVEELDLKEIGAATGLNEGTIKSHLSRALTAVRAKLRGTA